MLKKKIKNYRNAYVEIHFHPWFFLFKKEKNFPIKTKENMRQTQSFQELVAWTAAGGLFAVMQGGVFVCGL